MAAANVTLNALVGATMQLVCILNMKSDNEILHWTYYGNSPNMPPTDMTGQVLLQQWEAVQSEEANQKQMRALPPGNNPLTSRCPFRPFLAKPGIN